MATQTEARRTVLRDLIDDRGLRHRFVADKLGVLPSSLTRLLNRDRELRASDLLVLAELLGVGSEVFFDGRGLRLSEALATVPPVAEAGRRRG